MYFAINIIHLLLQSSWNAHLHYVKKSWYSTRFSLPQLYSLSSFPSLSLHTLSPPSLNLALFLYISFYHMTQQFHYWAYTQRKP